MAAQNQQCARYAAREIQNAREQHSRLDTLIRSYARPGRENRPQ